MDNEDIYVFEKINFNVKIIIKVWNLVKYFLVEGNLICLYILYIYLSV